MCTHTGQKKKVVEIVAPSVAGGAILLFLIIWVVYRKRKIPQHNGDPPNDAENEPFVGENGGDEIVNYFSTASEGSELTSGGASSCAANPLSPGSSCSDITEPKKDTFNSKIKNYLDASC